MRITPRLSGARRGRSHPTQQRRRQLQMANLRRPLRARLYRHTKFVGKWIGQQFEFFTIDSNPLTRRVSGFLDLRAHFRNRGGLWAGFHISSLWSETRTCWRELHSIAAFSAVTMITRHPQVITAAPTYTYVKPVARRQLSSRQASFARYVEIYAAAVYLPESVVVSVVRPVRLYLPFRSVRKRHIRISEPKVAQIAGFLPVRV